MSAEQLTLSFGLSRGDFTLSVDEALVLDGITAVFGPSGSGKTSLLRAISGLEMPHTGCVRFGDQVWFDAGERVNVKPHRRGVGYVFQDGRLFDHLTVRGNLAFADKRSGGAGMGEVVEATGLGGLLDRSVASLSGGESRRVALARALLSRPTLLLLDEPLTGLDRAARRSLLPYLKTLPQRFGIPALFVSHDVEEVAALADNILVLDAGRVVAHGRMQKVMRQLDLAPLMQDGRHGAVIEAAVGRHDEAAGVTQLELADQRLTLPLDAALKPGERVRLFIDASDVSLALARPEGISIRNVLRADIVALSGDGPVLVELQIADALLRSEVTRAAVQDLGLAVGQQVYVLIKTMSFAGR